MCGARRTWFSSIGSKQESGDDARERGVPFVSSLVSNYVGIDLGTATTVVYVEGKGVILMEPTLVAVNKKTEHVVAVGKKARVMIGRTPEHITVIQPVQRGVVYDYEVTEQLFEYIFRKVQDVSPKFLGPTVIVRRSVLHHADGDKRGEGCGD